MAAKIAKLFNPHKYISIKYTNPHRIFSQEPSIPHKFQMLQYQWKGSVSTKADDCPNKREFIVGCARFVQHDFLCSGFWLH